jgi:signal transduction histidine kinase/CheY-like chemotaxis protein
MERRDFDHWKGREVARLLALVETERRYYQEMVATVPVPLAVLGADRIVASANRAFRQLFALTTESLHQPIEQILPSDRLIEKIRDLQINRVPQPEFTIEHANKLLRVALLPMRGWDDEMAMETLLVATDVSELRAQVPAAAVPAPAVAFATENLPAVLWRADAATLQFKEVTGAADRLLGHPAAHWLKSPDFFAIRIHPDDRDATLAHYRTAIENAREASAEFRAITAAGETLWVRETVLASEPGVLTGVCTAIEQRKQIEQQRVIAERTAALRGLSARLAHDINNPLMIVTGYAEEMLHGLAANDPRRGDVVQILAATERMSGLTAQMLQFTRKHAAAAQSVELTAILTGLKAKIVPANLETSEPVWALANRQQLEEIVIALATAARRDAGPSQQIILRCDSAVITELVEAAAPALKPGLIARLAVHSSGPVVPAEKLPDLFESFLIKDPASPEQNTVAALARAYGVVREWGGDIGFDGDPRGGSTFTIYLPLAKPEPDATPPAAARPAVTDAKPLLPIPQPDAKPGIRALVAKILRREGYVVLEAGSGKEAMTVTLIHGAPIQLLLTDVMLPDRSGREVAEQLHAAVAGLKVLYISGFTDDESVRTGNFPPGSRFLQKPFTLGALVGTVREAMDG